MAMGKRKAIVSRAMWVAAADLPTAASHPFYRRLNRLLRDHVFADLNLNRHIGPPLTIAPALSPRESPPMAGVAGAVLLSG